LERALFGNELEIPAGASVMSAKVLGCHL